MKKITGFLLIIFMAGFGLNSIAQSFKAEDVLGIWFNEEKDAKIEIYKQGDQYFGKIVWLEEPIDPETGKAKVDDENPEEELQTRPIMGLLLVKDFEWDGELWDDGEIYDPKSGNTYDCYMKLEEKDKLKVRGYIGISLIGRTTYWTRTTL
ncbi:MAG TPA: DUF2147 domain-containing protein [Bacteroidales bacterium]|nr:DUF2147 domain-containing protein [Bacteroidales bacterium]HPE56227.1 DUF2147 domain-containing protein [Bacteroidales bacterium]HRX98074.1 DUF2147 domain-containing protein [Bacteroidales bacterium]